MVGKTFYILSCGCAFFTLIFAFSYPLYAIRCTLHAIQATNIDNQTLVHFRHFRHFSSLLTILPSTTVVRALQIHPFLTNKANFRKSQMNISKVIVAAYEIMDTWWNRKNKANSKPIQTQYKPNTNPIQTQTNPI